MANQKADSRVANLLTGRIHPRNVDQRTQKFATRMQTSSLSTTLLETKFFPFYSVFSFIRGSLALNRRACILFLEQLDPLDLFEKKRVVQRKLRGTINAFS